GSASRRAHWGLWIAPVRQPANTAKITSQLRPKPSPTQSSVGSSQSQWKLDSKFATNGQTSHCGRTDKAFWFHQPAAGKKGGTRLSNKKRKVLPQIPTSGFFICMPGSSSANPDQSPQYRKLRMDVGRNDTSNATRSSTTAVNGRAR